MSQQVQETGKIKKARRGSPSLFGPIVLIAIGVYFLLYNLDMLPAPNWAAALQFWPLLLIFFGLDILAQQFRSPWGAMISALLALIALYIFADLLLGGEFTPFFQENWFPKSG